MLKTVPTELLASTVLGFLVIISSILIFFQSWVTASWIMSSSVTNPRSVFPLKTGSCLIPLSIISLAVLANGKSGVTLGADCIKDFTLVVLGSSLEFIIHFLAITPMYFSLVFKTARTGGLSFLKRSRHLDNVLFS